MSDKRALLRLENVNRDYKGSDVVSAVRGITLNIERGDFLAIVGRSGSGKSTLLNILGLLDQPTDGTYFIDGADIAALSERSRDAVRGRRFGFVFQDSHGLEHRSVAKNIELTLVTQGYSASVRNALVREALDTVDLLRRANHLVRDLSGGERQRMAIARAIVHTPEVLLVDEPTGSLDTVNAGEIHRLLNRLNEIGTTVIAVTHDERLASVAKRRVLIEDGAVVEDTNSHRATAARSSTPTSVNEHRANPVTVWADRISDSVMAVAERGMKSLLSIFVIALGVAGVVMGVGINTSATAQVNQIFNEAALDEVRIATRSDAPGMTESTTKVAEDLHGVRHAGLLYSLSAEAVSVSRIPASIPQSTEYVATVLGVSASTLSVFGVAEAGRYTAVLTDPVLAQHSVLLGANAAEQLHVVAPGPGVRIWINDHAFTVAGIIEPDVRHASVSSTVLISNQAMSTKIAPHEFPTLVVKTDPGMSGTVATALPLAIDPAQPGNYVPQSTADLADLRASVDGSLVGVFSAVAAVLLIVAILSTSSSLSASVLHRQREIGLRRALGTSRASVAGAFTREGLLLGTMGGLLGAGLGVSGLVGLSLAQGWPIHMDMLAVVVAVGAGAFAGVIASVAPAIRASQLVPALALRA